MDMLAVQLLRHTAGFLRADMTAEYLCHGFHIAAALGMYNLAVLIRLAVAALAFHRRDIAAVAVGMDALGYTLVARICVLMTASMAIHSWGIPAGCRVLRVVLAQAVAFRGDGRYRSKAKHHYEGKNEANYSL